MKRIMITFAWTVCVLTACDKNKPSQTGMQALPIDVAKPLVENVTLTKDYPGYLEAESTVDLVGRWFESDKRLERKADDTKVLPAFFFLPRKESSNLFKIYTSACP